MRKGERFLLPVVLIASITLLTGGAGAAGYLLGRGTGVPAEATSTSDRPSLSIFWEAWDVLNRKFYGNANTDKRLDGAIGGMVAGLEDPYTTYLPPKESKIFKADLEGSFGGIGARLEMRNNLLTIVAPLQGTPAERAGLLANDVIAKIDGKEVGEFVDAIDAIRGDPGTTVTLTILRGEELQEMPVTRDTIVVKSVETSTAGATGEVAYIKINQFNEDTTGLVRTGLEAAVREGKKGAILDLRNNPGGLLDQAANVIGLVIPQKPQASEEQLQSRVAVREQFKDKPERVYRATTNPIAESLPIVVLVNGGSASASEIFAGAMKDYKRAKVIGVKTFGKGSVQELVELENGGSIKVTVAHWLTPLGSEINGSGIEPDETVELSEGESVSSTDTQVRRALELLGVLP